MSGCCLQRSQMLAIDNILENAKTLSLSPEMTIEFARAAFVAGEMNNCWVTLGDDKTKCETCKKSGVLNDQLCKMALMHIREAQNA